MYFCVVRLIARMLEIIIAIKDANTVLPKRICGSANPSHSMATNTGMSSDTSPNNGKNNKTPAKPRVLRIIPNIVALCALIIHNCNQHNVTQCGIK